MPTAYDKFLQALDDDVAPRGPLPVNRSIQPIAPIAWGAEFLNPSLADRPYGIGSQSSVPLGVPAVGTAGAYMLAKVAADGQFEIDETPAWFWVQNIKVSIAAPGDNEYGLSWPVGADTGVTFATAVSRFAMGPAPLQLGVYGLLTQNLSVPPTRVLTMDNFGTSVTSAAPWIGPLFKPPGRIPLISAVNQQTHASGNFRWVELPNPRNVR